MFGNDDRFARLLALAVVGFVCLAAAPGVAGAQEQRTGGTVTIGPDETHEGDLEVTAGEVLVEGTVDGDLTATGGSVTVTGEVTGAMTATAGSVIVEGDIGGDTTATGGDVHLREGATVDGTLEATGGNVTVDGSVTGDARLDGDTVTVGPTASVDGDLTYSADRSDIDEDASIAGSVTELDDPGVGPFSDVSVPDLPDAAVTPLIGLYLFSANFLLGAVLLSVAPRFSDRVSRQGIDRPAASGGVGLATLVGAPFLIAALFLSVVGIPLAFFAGYAFVFALWIGLIYGAFVIGTWGLARLDRGHRWGALALGLAAVSLLNALPYVGVLLVVIALLGLGAFVRTLYERRTDRDDGNDGDDNDGDRRPADSAGHNSASEPTG
jgi:cytoskeletal protein CcmA (bactofilin family)